MPLLEKEEILKCTCRANNTPHAMCAGALRLDEQGVKAELIPRDKEEAQLIVMDGCYCSTHGKKCDALFLLKGSRRNHLIVVELKSSHVQEGVEQLSLTRKRQEYRKLKEAFTQKFPRPALREKAFLVSTQVLGSRDRVKMTRDWGVSFKSLVVTKGSGKIKNLRLHF